MKFGTKVGLICNNKENNLKIAIFSKLAPLLGELGHIYYILQNLNVVHKYINLDKGAESKYVISFDN